MRHTPHSSQRGQAIVLVALLMIALFAMAALAFDAGDAQSDRMPVRT